MFELGIYSAIAPFILLLLSSMWSYPPVLEEVVKWGILRSKILDVRSQILGGAVVGLVFGLSEAVLFASNSWMLGDWSSMVGRLLLTVPMHTATASVTAWGMSRRMGWVGLLIAMGMHAGFNYFVGSMR